MCATIAQYLADSEDWDVRVKVWTVRESSSRPPDAGRDADDPDWERTAPVGALLRRHRLEAGLTQEALAVRAGLGLRTVQDLELGVHYPRREIVQHLLRALDLAGDRRVRFETAAQPLPRRQPETILAPIPRRDLRFLGPRVGEESRGARRSNLPVSWSSFVGRESELREVARLLERARLVTLTGAGGVGKSRLAQEVGRSFVGKLADGVWRVELAALADPLLVHGAMALALGLREEAGQPIVERLLRYARFRRLMLILDNCEHLIDACAELVQVMLGACPEVVILATSREPLRLTGENVFRVPSLPFPVAEQVVNASDLTHFASARLFADCAVEGSGFVLADANAAAVGRICRSLDGIPLALELAAARLSALIVEQVAERLDQQFRLLSEGVRAALPRHRTMRATIDWSYDMLTDSEQRSWRQLAVFAGGFTLEAAEAVVGISGDDVLDLVARLVDRSLVVREEREGTARYRLLEPLRQYAWEKLVEAGEADAARERHVDWCVKLTTGSTAEHVGPRHVAWAEQTALESDNLRAALGWCLDRDASRGLRLVRNLGLFWGLWGIDPEGQRWRDAMLARATEDTPERALALLQAGIAARDLGDVSMATARLQDSYATSRRVGDPLAMSWTLVFLGELALGQGRDVEARALYDESLRLARDIGEESVVFHTLFDLAELISYQGDDARARAIVDECLADAWVREHSSYRAWALLHSGTLAHATGDLPRAKEVLEESVALFRVIVDRPGLGSALAHLGYLIGSLGDYRQAESLQGEALKLFQKLGHRPRAARTLLFMGLVAIREGYHARGVTLLATAEATPGFFLAGLDSVLRTDRDERLADARRALGDAIAHEAWARGSAMTIDEAVASTLTAENVDIA